MISIRSFLPPLISCHNPSPVINRSANTLATDVMLMSIAVALRL